MKELTSSDANELLSQLEKSVASIKEQGLQTWSSGYLKKHRIRYLSDLNILKHHYVSGNILELGALPCHMTFILRQLKIPVVSIDINPNRAEEFIQKNALEVIACDIETQRIPSADNTFSTVLMNEVFEHLRINPLHALRETERVLMPDGKLIITTPNLYSLRNRWRFFTGRGLGDPVKAFQKLEAMGHMGHLREYSRKELIRFLKVAGLKLLDHRYTYYHTPKLLIKPFYWLFPKLRPYQVLVVTK